MQKLCTDSALDHSMVNVGGFAICFVHPTLHLITFRVHFPFLSEKLLTDPCLMTPQVPTVFKIASVIN